MVLRGSVDTFLNGCFEVYLFFNQRDSFYLNNCGTSLIGDNFYYVWLLEYVRSPLPPCTHEATVTLIKVKP
jgi:hypothetical protein